MRPGCGMLERKWHRRRAQKSARRMVMRALDKRRRRRQASEGCTSSAAARCGTSLPEHLGITDDVYSVVSPPRGSRGRYTKLDIPRIASRRPTNKSGGGSITVAIVPTHVSDGVECLAPATQLVFFPGLYLAPDITSYAVSSRPRPALAAAGHDYYAYLGRIPSPRIPGRAQGHAPPSLGPEPRLTLLISRPQKPPSPYFLSESLQSA